MSLYPTVTALAQQSDRNMHFRPQDAVIKLHTIKISIPVKLDFGTGWCLDPQCGLVVSNYHIAMLLGRSLEIRGEKIVQTQLATGPEDEGATLMQWRQKSVGPSLKLVPNRDIAIFRLGRPLSLAHKEMHGIPLYAGQLQAGEGINVYAYPVGGKLAIFPGRFVRELKDGILEFEVRRSNSGQVAQPGISGGVILNRNNQAVGLVWGMEQGDKLLQAVPIWSLSDFVKKAEPDIYPTLFPGEIYRPDAPIPAGTDAESDHTDTNLAVSTAGMSPGSILPDFYLGYESRKVIPPLASTSSTELQRRADEPISVQLLRNNAQHMVESMTDFVAVQTLQFGGGKEKETTAQDEVRQS